MKLSDNASFSLYLFVLYLFTFLLSSQFYWYIQLKSTAYFFDPLCSVVVCPSGRLSVWPSQAGIVSTRIEGQSCFLAWELPLTYPKLCYEEKRVSVKTGGKELCLKTLNLENFAIVSRRCGQQNSSMVELVDYTYDGRMRRGWMHKVYYTSIDCNSLTPILQRVPDLLYNLFLHYCVAVGKVSTDTSRRAVRLH